MKRLKQYVLFLITITIGGLMDSSCNIINPDEQEPAYLQIDSFNVIDNPNVNEGSLSHDIRDAWVFVDDEMIGIFELPARIPVLEKGSHKLLVGPGIFISTVSTLRDNYLFYEAYETGIDLVPGEIIEITPEVRYRDENETYFYIPIENFEESFYKMSKVSGSEADLVRTTDPNLVYEGSGSGLVVIDDTSVSAAIRTTESYGVINKGKIIFVEFDYLTDYDLVFGLHIDNRGFQDETSDYLTLRKPSEGSAKWKKAYVAIGGVIDAASNPESYYLFFRAKIDDNSPSSGKFMIDNLKLLGEY